MDQPRQRRTERISPRISLNSLAEYMTASPARRASIVKDQKRPSDFVVALYTEAEEAVIEALEAFARNASAFDLSNAAVTIQPHSADKLLISGVEVSVRPELGLVVNSRTGPQSGSR